MTTFLSDALAQALSGVSAFKGESLQYRTTHGGSLTALPAGFILHRDRVPPPVFVQDTQSENETKEGTLKGPLSPAMAIGYEVVDSNGEAWAVYSLMSDQQQICRVRRSRKIAMNPDRGHTR